MKRRQFLKTSLLAPAAGTALTALPARARRGREGAGCSATGQVGPHRDAHQRHLVRRRAGAFRLAGAPRHRPGGQLFRQPRPTTGQSERVIGEALAKLGPARQSLHRFEVLPAGSATRKA